MNNDFAAKTHRCDTGGTENPKTNHVWMHSEACVCVTRSGIRLCERCASVVTHPFCRKRDR